MNGQKKPEAELDKEELERLRAVVLSWATAKNKKLSPNPPAPPTKEVVTQIPTAPSLKSGRQKKKHSVLSILVWAAGIAIVGLVTFGFTLYQFTWTTPLVANITAIIPYPAAFVEFTPLSYRDWLGQAMSLEQFYRNEAAQNPALEIPTSRETKRHILERMIDQTLIKQLAESYQIAVLPSEVEEQTKALTTEIGSRESLERQLDELYGWSLKDFQKEILVPVLLRNKVSVAVTLDDRLNAQARSRAEEILAQVKKNPDSFASVAQTVSQDASAVQGGDIGYFSRGQMVPAFEEAAFTLTPGQISGVIKTQFGYHIIKLEEQLTDEDGEVTQLRARHILIRGKDLDTYLGELRESKRIIRLLRL